MSKTASQNKTTKRKKKPQSQISLTFGHLKRALSSAVKAENDIGSSHLAEELEQIIVTHFDNQYKGDIYVLTKSIKDAAREGRKVPVAKLEAAAQVISGKSNIVRGRSYKKATLTPEMFANAQKKTPRDVQHVNMGASNLKEKFDKVGKVSKGKKGGKKTVDGNKELADNIITVIDMGSDQIEQEFGSLTGLKQFVQSMTGEEIDTKRDSREDVISNAKRLLKEKLDSLS